MQVPRVSAFVMRYKEVNGLSLAPFRVQDPCLSVFVICCKEGYGLSVAVDYSA